MIADDLLMTLKDLYPSKPNQFLHFA